MNKKKSILVTSGSKRLGKHISKFFVMNDWDLILHYNNSKVEAEETANELSTYSKNIKLYIPEEMFFSFRLYEYIISLNFSSVKHSASLLGFKFFTFSGCNLYLLINK